MAESVAFLLHVGAFHVKHKVRHTREGYAGVGRATRELSGQRFSVDSSHSSDVRANALCIDQRLLIANDSRWNAELSGAPQESAMKASSVSSQGGIFFPKGSDVKAVPGSAEESSGVSTPAAGFRTHASDSTSGSSDARRCVRQRSGLPGVAMERARPSLLGARPLPSDSAVGSTTS